MHRIIVQRYVVIILMKYYYAGWNMVRYILKGNILDAIIEVIVIRWDYEGNIVYFDMYIGIYAVD